jgi:hypothetical protein
MPRSGVRQYRLLGRRLERSFTTKVLADRFRSGLMQSVNPGVSGLLIHEMDLNRKVPSDLGQ